MNEAHTRGGEFARVAENLYRYSSSGVYYARFRGNGKEISRSLRTTDRTLAKRRLAEEMENFAKIDPKIGKMATTCPVNRRTAVCLLKAQRARGKQPCSPKHCTPFCPIFKVVQSNRRLFSTQRATF